MAPHSLAALSDSEEQELGKLEALGWRRDAEQSARYWELMARKCPPPSTEQASANREKLKAQGVDFDAAYAAFNRGDLQHVAGFLQRVATPKREQVARLERAINTSLRRPSRRLAISRPSRTHARGTVRRSSRRAVRLAAHGPPGRPGRPGRPSDDPDPSDLAGRPPRVYSCRHRPAESSR